MVGFTLTLTISSQPVSYTHLDVYKRQNVYRKLQGHWIIEMSEMMATANAKSIEEIKSFLSRQKEVYKIPYETHPADRPRQCVFGGTSNALDFLPLDRSGNRRFIPVMVYPEQAEVHILEDEAASRDVYKRQGLQIIAQLIHYGVFRQFKHYWDFGLLPIPSLF